MEILRGFSFHRQATCHIPFTGLGRFQCDSAYPGKCPKPKLGAESALNGHLCLYLKTSAVSVMEGKARSHLEPTAFQVISTDG